MDDVQCPRTAAELSIWGHGESGLHLRDSDNYLWRKSSLLAYFVFKNGSIKIELLPGLYWNLTTFCSDPSRRLLGQL